MWFQAQSLQHVPGRLQEELDPYRGLLLWRPHDWRSFCEYNLEVSSLRLMSSAVTHTPPPPPPPALFVPQKAMEQEEGEEEEEKEAKPDPLHQLILHFSRTALTEKRLGFSWSSLTTSELNEPYLEFEFINLSNESYQVTLYSSLWEIRLVSHNHNLTETCAHYIIFR